MSTNFLPWNPAENNQETDTAYNADTLRANGVTTGAILPSSTFNKFAYQQATFIAAFAQMMVNKGYSPNDSNFSTLVSVLTNVKCGSDFLTSIVTVPYASSITFNAAVSAQYDLTLTGNVTTSALSGQVAGQLLLFIISQDGTGGRTFSWPSSITGGGAICSVSNTTSIQMFVVRPAGAIEPVWPMIWVNSSGIIAQSPVGVVAINSTGTVSSAYSELVEKVDASGGAVTRTLYTAVGFKGFKVNIKKVDTSNNGVTILPNGSQTIDGFSNIVIYPQYESLTFVSDGSNWYII